MREHEVPTHVQAEDRVLLWFTFPQIVAVTAVCALSYGAYSYAPVGPTELADRAGRRPRRRRYRDDRGEDRGQEPAAGGRRPSQVPAGSSRCYAGPRFRVDEKRAAAGLPRALPTPLRCWPAAPGAVLAGCGSLRGAGWPGCGGAGSGGPSDLTCGSGNAVNQSRQTVASKHGEARPANPVEPRPQVTFFVW